LQITDPARVQAAMSRYLTNKDIAQGIANQFGIEAIFAWQPVPLYKYNLVLHPFQIEDEHRRVRYGYPAMANYVATHDVGANFAWCADVLGSADHSVYVDQVHYTAEGNRLIAACIGDTIMSSGALDRIRQRKPVQSAATAARGGLSTGIEAPDVAPMATRAIAPVFGPQALTDDMQMSKPLGEWSDALSGGVQLTDASANYAVIYESFPLDRAPAERTNQVSIRIKPSTSDYLGLAMICVGGPNSENVVMFVNPRTMGVIAASGHHSLNDEPGGWTRLTLTGSCKDPGNDRVQVMLYPAHRAPENRGAVIFGGGEIRRVVNAPVQASGRESQR
jgi:hypothetical protein